MGNDRTHSKAKQTGNGGNRPNASDNRIGNRADTGRQMVPFFTDEDKGFIQNINLNGTRPGKPRRQSGNHKRVSKETPLPQFSGREVGVNTLPIGQFSLTSNSEQPLGLDLAQIKEVGAKVRNGSNVIDLFGKMAVSKYDMDNDTNSERPGSNYTMSTTFETVYNLEYSETGSEAQDVESYYCDNLRTTARIAHWMRHEEMAMPTPFGMDPRLPNRYGIQSMPRSQGPSPLGPEVPTKVTRRPKAAYAFSKYVCSPDPSSIPVPWTQ
ncbi:N-terminus replication primase, putative [Babesia ovis]|uniref:N-terminus replication primase, putative n=1 Tax=Babesia ovis TaxID=5869 RepID=A0A9W5T956_BABOV|nr:N-terminus replication primase, putative [Babesia ovis]